MGDADVATAKQAARQWGVISRAQALERLTRDQVEYRLRSREWLQLYPGVYRLAGAPLAWEQRYQGLALYLGAGFAFSHRSAARLHGLADGPEFLEVVTTRQIRLEGVRAHRVDELSDDELEQLRGFPVTSVPRTLLDLSAVLSAPALRRVTDKALQRKRTTVEVLGTALREAGRRKGLKKLWALHERYVGGDGPAESELEQLVYDCLESAGLPRPVRQRVVRAEGRVRRLDLCYPVERVVIEADGFATHSSPEAFEADRVRNNALLAEGYRVLHWTWQALRQRPAPLVEQLAAVLGRGARALAVR